MSKKKKKTKVQHVTYNVKSFLAPKCIKSMSAVHTKIYSDGTAIVRISDCHQSIKIWNNLNDRHEVLEMAEKLTQLIDVLSQFEKEIITRYGITRFKKNE